LFFCTCPICVNCLFGSGAKINRHKLNNHAAGFQLANIEISLMSRTSLCALVCAIDMSRAAPFGSWLAAPAANKPSAPAIDVNGVRSS
jgi:hypothetical protein